MKTMMVKFLAVVLATGMAGCTDKPAREASDPPPPPPAPSNAPAWEIGEDIAGKKVIIDGKEVVIPDDVADSKRKMDAVAKEKLDAMDALEQERLERFNDPDMQP